MGKKRDRQRKMAKRDLARKLSLDYLKYKTENGKRINGFNPAGMTRIELIKKGELRKHNQSKEYFRQDLTESGSKALAGVSRKVIVAKIVNRAKYPNMPYRHLCYEWA